MQSIDLLNFIEGNYSHEFVNLHVINNSVVGFYKTMLITYQDTNNATKSYLFPTTFIFKNNRIETTMIFGSVNNNFTIPYDINGTGHGSELKIFGVGFHLYKLLGAVQTDSENTFDKHSFSIKAFMVIIHSLYNIGFPFMRIADNTSITKNKM